MSTCKIENMSFKDKIKTILDKDLHIERELEDLEFKKILHWLLKKCDG